MFLTVLLMSTSSCSLDTTPRAPDPRDGGTDSTAMDGSSDPRPPDVAMETAVPADSAPLDTVSDAPPGSCDAIYGGAPEYVFCEESTTQCSISTRTNSDCNTFCALFGETCITAYDNPDGAGNECKRTLEEGCDMDRGTEICVCTRT